MSERTWRGEGKTLLSQTWVEQPPAAPVSPPASPPRRQWEGGPTQIALVCQQAREAAEASAERTRVAHEAAVSAAGGEEQLRMLRLATADQVRADLAALRERHTGRKPRQPW